MNPILASAAATDIARSFLDFHPLPWLRNGHLQTVLGHLLSGPPFTHPTRQHVLWFDEIYASHADYGWDRVLDAVGRMRLALCVGTSFSVGVTDLVSSAARNAGLPLFAVEPNGPAGPVDPAVTGTHRHAGAHT